MPPNPYQQAEARQRARRQAESPWAWAAAWLPALVLVAILPLLQRGTDPDAAGGIYRFLESPRLLIGGSRDLVLRIGLLLSAGLALGGYQRLVRGPDRGVIDLHPLRADLWLQARLPELFRDSLPWLACGLAPLLPMYPHPRLFAAAATLVGGAWVAGLGLGAGINLVAPSVGSSPAWAPVLDAIRGVNPRMQAALLYAPGAAFGLGGLSLIGAAAGLEAVAGGAAWGWGLLLLPWLAGAAGVGLAWIGRARLSLLPLILGEVEAAWAAQEDPGEASRVYLEWVLRFVPAGWRLAMLRDLRQGWREERSSLLGLWGVGALAGIAAWSRAGAAGLLAAAGAIWIGWIGVRMRQRDPEWLDVWLPLPPAQSLPARTLALWLWMQPPLLLGGGLGWIRGAGIGGLLWEVGALLLAGGSALTGMRWRAQAGWIYPGVALLVLAGWTRWAQGGG